MFSTRLKLSVFLSLSTILVGCAPESPHPTGAIDFQGFSDLEVQEIQADLAELGTIQNHDVTFIAQSNLGNEPGGYTIIGESEVGVPHCHIILDPNDFSGTPEQPSLIQQSVVWHEYGHCAGLYHDTDQQAIMYFLVNYFINYTSAEKTKFVNEVRQLGGIQ